MLFYCFKERPCYKRIVKRLDFADLCRLGGVCKQIRDELLSNEDIWRHMCSQWIYNRKAVRNPFFYLRVRVSNMMEKQFTETMRFLYGAGEGVTGKERLAVVKRFVREARMEKRSVLKCLLLPRGTALYVHCLSIAWLIKEDADLCCEELFDFNNNNGLNMFAFAFTMVLDNSLTWMLERAFRYKKTDKSKIYEAYAKAIEDTKKHNPGWHQEYLVYSLWNNACTALKLQLLRPD